MDDGAFPPPVPLLKLMVALRPHAAYAVNELFSVKINVAFSDFNGTVSLLNGEGVDVPYTNRHPAKVVHKEGDAVVLLFSVIDLPE